MSMQGIYELSVSDRAWQLARRDQSSYARLSDVTCGGALMHIMDEFV